MARCAHALCTCTHDASRMIASEGRFYCSEYCIRPPREPAAPAPECHCGHPECGTVPGPAQPQEAD